MTENDPRSSARPPSTPGGPMSERMQALLSRAAEEQLSEQRQVSAVLTDLRALVSGISEQLRGTASSSRLEGLGGDLASLATELRMSTAALGDRLDGLARRVDEQAASTAEIVSTNSNGTEALAVRVGGMAEDLAGQSAAVDRLTAAVTALSAFPDALAAIQREVSTMHDRLAPLTEVRTGLADLTARTGAVEALRPEVAAIGEKLDGLATGAEVTRARDSLVAAVAERLDRLETLAARPVLTPEGFDAALAPLHTRLDELAAAGPVVDRLGSLDARLAALEERLVTIAGRIEAVGEAAGGVPAVAGELARVAARVDELAAVREDVAAVRSGLSALQEDGRLPSLVLSVATLREDVEDIGNRVGEIAFPSSDSVATAVGQQVTDRLVDELAPRVADVVLTRVAATLVDQVAGSVTASVQNGLTEKVRAASADSERRISAHVDEAVLALAEALLRRRRGARTGLSAVAGIADLEASVGEAAPVAEAAVPVPQPSAVQADRSEGAEPGEAAGAAEAEALLAGADEDALEDELGEGPADGLEDRAADVTDATEPAGASEEPAGASEEAEDASGVQAGAQEPGPPAGSPAAVGDDGWPEIVSADEEDDEQADDEQPDEEDDEDDVEEPAAQATPPARDTGIDSSHAPVTARTSPAPAAPASAPAEDEAADDEAAEDEAADDEQQAASAPQGFTTFTMPRAPIVEPTPDLDEDVEESVPTAPPAAYKRTPSTVPAPTQPVDPEWDEDEDGEPGPPRRPWWRPGG